MNNNLEFENTDPSPDSVEDNHPRTNYGEGWVQERMYSEEEVIKAYHDAYHKGYRVGQKDAESHPLALTIANNMHIDRNKWFEQFKKK